ncbi:NAD(P)-dependent oxidoreductase [Parvularcula sp. LCG005]|uniref:NAD-dependent epimerase/dehydratase family protein n=1 Tax=Parvularcula sp. LCG005 TaxID=3078805 RepID=UPI0029438F4C|nr:NAD(P)-dependent oxidoreductase [Parvularcula sp. LCG005]WOI54049.1 NAD(P)-dependent oxidoreductase [Parvularcula sp. LCG005]
MTGSEGLVGVGLVRALARLGHDVVAYDVLRTPAEDIRDAAAVARAVDGVDGIVHLAALSRVGWGESHSALTDEVNIGGTEVLVDAAARSPKAPFFLFVSSREVYGNPDTLPVTEGMPIAPLNTYGRSKAEGERLVQAAAASGLRTAIIRLSNVYGNRADHPDRAVPSLLWRALQHTDLTITGAETFFDFVHVDDCVDGLVKAVDALSAGRHDLPPVHLTTGVLTSLGQLATLVCERTASRSVVHVVPARVFDVEGFVGDPARARDVYDWQPTIDLATGVDMLATLMREEGPPPPITVPLSLPLLSDLSDDV